MQTIFILFVFKIDMQSTSEATVSAPAGPTKKKRDSIRKCSKTEKKVEDLDKIERISVLRV